MSATSVTNINVAGQNISDISRDIVIFFRESVTVFHNMFFQLVCWNYFFHVLRNRRSSFSFFHEFWNWRPCPAKINTKPKNFMPEILSRNCSDSFNFGTFFGVLFTGMAYQSISNSLFSIKIIFRTFRTTLLIQD